MVGLFSDCALNVFICVSVIRDDDVLYVSEGDPFIGEHRLFLYMLPVSVDMCKTPVFVIGRPTE